MKRWLSRMTINRPKAGTGFKFLLSLACAIVVVAGFRAASELLIPIVLGMFLAMLSLPVLKTLMKWGVPRAIAIGMTIAIDLMILLVIGFLAMSAIPEFQNQREAYAELLRKRLSEWTESIDKRLETFSGFMENFKSDANSEAAKDGEKTAGASASADPATPTTTTPGTTNGGAVEPDPSLASGTSPPVEAGVGETEASPSQTGNMLTLKGLLNKYWDSKIIIDFIGQTELVQRLTSLLSKSFFVLIIMIFVLAESGQFARKYAAVRQSQGPDLSRFQDSAADIQKYLGIKTAVSLATGILAYLACRIFGVEFAILWALVAFAFNYIPAIGSILAAVPPVVLALIESGFWPGLGVFICYLVINIGLGNFLEPMLLGNRFGISTVVVILSVLFWGYIWGPVGMFLAVPLTMMVKVMLDNSTDLQWVSVLMGKQRRPIRGKTAPLGPSAIPPKSAGDDLPQPKPKLAE
jgi:predicted PurR-regulated permease PerM